MQLYLDDGVPSRRNRNILNNTNYLAVGAAYSTELETDGELI